MFVYSFCLCSQFKAANSTDLWVILTQESRRTSTISSRKHLNRIMKAWTDQSGYPLIQVDRNPNGTIQLTQVRNNKETFITE